MPRWMELSLRVLAAVTLICGAALAVAARVVGCGDIAPMLVVIVGPGLLPLLWPNTRSVATWAVIVWLAGMLFAVGGWAGGPPWFHPLVDRFIATLAAVLPFAGYGAAAASSDPLPAELSPLARRMRSLAITALGLGAALVVVGLFPGVLETGGVSESAGGAALPLFVALVASPAVLAYAQPRLRTGWRWMMWGLCLGAPAGAFAAFGYELRGPRDSYLMLWPRHAVELGIGTLLVLVLFVLPIVLIASDDEMQPELPSARVR